MSDDIGTSAEHSLVHVLDLLPLDPVDRVRLEAVSPLLKVTHGQADDWKTVNDPDLEVIFGRYAPEREAAPKLRWLQVRSAGVDYLTESAPWSRGLIVTTARGIYAVPMAEYAMTAILNASQRVEERRLLQLKSEWPASAEEFGTSGLRDRTLVIVGYGSAGREVARLAAAFGMRIIAVKVDLNPRERSSFREPGTGDPTGALPGQVVGVEEIEWAFGQADYVVLTLALTPSSRGLVGRRLLSKLNRRAWIVNISRGGVIDEDALVEALRDRAVAGAWLDAFHTEPLPADSPLWSLPNVTITPHVAGVHANNFRNLADLCCENLRRYLANEPLLNVVDPAKGY